MTTEPRTEAGRRLLAFLPNEDAGWHGLPAAILAIEAEAFAAGREAALGPDLDKRADDVRYGGGNGTSDYWRGFNDGIDKLVAHLRAAHPVEAEEKPDAR